MHRDFYDAKFLKELYLAMERKYIRLEQTGYEQARTIRIGYGGSVGK